MSKNKFNETNLAAAILDSVIGKHSVDIPEVTKEEIYEANQNSDCENPIVVNAAVQCSKMQNSNAKSFIFVGSSTCNERNGESGVRDIDIIMVPNTFGKCQELQGPCHPVIEEGKWQGCDEGNMINGRSGVTMLSYMICTNGGGMIVPITDGQKLGCGEVDNQKLIEQAHEIMQNWLDGGERVVPKEELDEAIYILATYGEQSSISSLNRISQKVIEEEKNELKRGMFERINSSITREAQYDNTILAWTNYWNMNMQKQYGENYSPIRAEVVKAMLVVESNMGEENKESTIIQNGYRDIKQSLDPRNPVFWTALGVEGNNRTITIEYAEEDITNLNLSEKDKTLKLSMNDGGRSDRNFLGDGKWGAVKELISEDYTIYYADKVTPELSLAVGEGYFCRQLNGAGSNGGVSIMRDEYKAAQLYNSGGDSTYTERVNIVLGNMGVDGLEKNID